MQTLEQLTSSHSVGGALKQPFLLRKFNWTTTLLMFIWALSPLAGQAILRMSSTTTHYDWDEVTVSYFSSTSYFNRPNDPSDTWRYMGGENGDFSSAFSILTALMQGYSRGGSSNQDIYNNLKVPVIGTRNNEYTPYDSYNDYISMANYTSLLGHPV